jgi:hypothetical protein
VPGLQLSEAARLNRKCDLLMICRRKFLLADRAQIRGDTFGQVFIAWKRHVDRFALHDDAGNDVLGFPRHLIEKLSGTERHSHSALFEQDRGKRGSQ